MWGFHVKSDVIVTPRYLYSLVGVRAVPSILKHGGLSEFTFFLEINICLHLIALNFRCFPEIYEDTELISDCNWSKSAGFFITRYKTMSSAKRFRSLSLETTDVTSFIYKMNSSGPRTEPCGTPEIAGREWVTSIHSNKLLSVEKVAINPSQ